MLVEEQISARQQRARKAIHRVLAKPTGEGYGDYEVRSASGRKYRVAMRGPSLFELIDADHDGKLSARELRSAWKRLSPWVTGPSHGISRRQLPHQHQVFVSFGLPGRAGSAMPGTAAPAGFNSAALLPAVPRRGGPVWFRRLRQRDAA